MKDRFFPFNYTDKNGLNRVNVLKYITNDQLSKSPKKG